MDDLVALLLSALLGTAVGWERQVDRKPAGLRTNAMVCIGSTLFVLTARHAAETFGSGTMDPTRIIHGIVTGIGFLGAGSILRHEGEVIGLTTAAGIWTVAAIGAAVGVGAYLLAITGTVLTFIVLRAYQLLDRKLTPEGPPKVGDGGR